MMKFARDYPRQTVILFVLVSAGIVQRISLIAMLAGWNLLRGLLGDKVNTLMAVIGYNHRMILRVFDRSIK